MAARVDAVDTVAVSLRVAAEALAADGPALLDHAARQHVREAQPGRLHGAEARRRHEFVGRAQPGQDGGSAVFTHEGAQDIVEERRKFGDNVALI